MIRYSTIIADDPIRNTHYASHLCNLDWPEQHGMLTGLVAAECRWIDAEMRREGSETKDLLWHAETAWYPEW